MRKLSYLLSLFILLTAFTCEDEPLEGDFFQEEELSCNVAAQNTQDAAVAFLDVNEENFTELCTAYRNALEAQIFFCGDPDGLLQTQLNSLGSCNNDVQVDDCASAAAAVGVAQAAFAQATNDNYTQLCNAYRDALLDLIAFCGDDGGTQSVLNDLGDCSNDNEPDESLIGTWLLTAWLGDEPIDLNNDGTESMNFLDEMDCYDNETLVFNADNSVVNTSTSFATFEYIIEVGTTNSFEFTVTCEQETEITNGTWSQNGNTVTIIDEFGEYDMTLNGNELSIFIPEGFVALNSEDVNVTTIQNLTFIYTKQ